MQKAKIDRLAGKIIWKNKNPSKWPTITENIQDIPNVKYILKSKKSTIRESFYVNFMPILSKFHAFTKSAFF